MKLNHLLLLALTLLTGAVAESVDDCDWLFGHKPSSRNIGLYAKCPVPRRAGDVYTVSAFELNKCLVTNAEGKIQPQKDGGAFRSVDADGCNLDHLQQKLDCGEHGSLPLDQIVKFQDDAWGCGGYKASTWKETYHERSQGAATREGSKTTLQVEPSPSTTSAK